MAEKVMNIVIIGAGGDGMVVAEAVRQCAEAGQRIQLAGFLDDTHARGARVCDVPVFGSTDEWAQAPQDCLFVPAIQKVRDMPRRAARLSDLNIPSSRWGQIIHPSAVVARDSQIGVGVYIAACATIQPGCVVDDFASVRAGAALGHDAKVSRFGYVGPNATMCGTTILDVGAHLGPNAVILDYRRVGRFAVVGIGCAVTKDIADYVVVMGNPARRVGFVAAYPAVEENQQMHSSEDEKL